MGWATEESGFHSCQKEVFSSPYPSSWNLMGTGVLSLGIKLTIHLL
jgi:hypothetical protein